MANLPGRTSELGRRLRAERERQEMTRATLAFRAEVSEPNIARIELYGTDPSIATVAKLAGALGVTVGSLLDPEPAEEVAG